ncbi:hypothetical protein R1flu_017883 [Riccia fluitans]|uniref:Uncharacterized protein n=1 Tax=Riccia fluitans TaxID=41844 RepID=A0ABD1ZE82_9MARC
MKQLQTVQLVIPGTTTLVAREKTPKATTLASPERPLANFQTLEGQSIAMETNTPTMILAERYQLDRLRADLDSSRQELETTRLEKERLENQVQELSAQLDQVQP